MTIAEMHIAVKLELDNTSNLENPAFEPEEIDFWLNQAIRKYVRTRYSGNNVLKQGFEQTQKRTDDLSMIVKEERILPTLNTDYNLKDNSYIAIIPDDYFVTTGEEVEIRHIADNGMVFITKQGITECTSDTYRQKIDDPYSDHKLHLYTAKPLRMYQEGNVILITDGNYTIDYYYLRYLRLPVEVTLSGNIDCDLASYVHDEIVMLTVNMMLENLGRERYKTQSAEVYTME